MNCPNCGEHLAEGAEVCMECGRPVKGSPEPGQRPPGVYVPGSLPGRPAERDTGGAKPAGVIVLTVLYALGGVGAIVLGMLLLGAGSVMTDAAQQVAAQRASVPGAPPVNTADVNAFLQTFFKIFGFGMMIGGLINFLIAWGLYSLQQWARVVAIIFACLGLVGGVVGLLRPAGGAHVIVTLVGIGMNVVMLYFLFGDADTVAAFS